MIAITAATGQLGQRVVEQLAAKLAPSRIIAVVRNPAKAGALAARGVAVRKGDYGDPAELERAFAGVEKLLLISSNELGRRAEQHRNAIEAAKRAGVGLIVYTSLLHANTTSLDLAPDHLQTEQALKASGAPHVILRNGWYSENYTASIGPALANGAFLGCAGSGRISSAARADYAAAAVAALTGAAQVGATYELAGDSAYTLAEFAAELSRQSGKSIPYRNLPESEYREILLKVGLPAPIAAGLASWDASAAGGALFDERHQLSRLIGRPTTPVAESIRAALAG